MWSLSGLHVLAASFGLCWWLCTEPAQPCDPTGSWWRWEEGDYLCFRCSVPWSGDGNVKPEVREGRTVSCWQPVLRLAKSDYRASCRETSKHWLIWKINLSSVKFTLSKTKPEILKHKMKHPEENTMLLRHPEVIQNVFCAWTNTGQFLPFNLWGNCDRSVG